MPTWGITPDQVKAVYDQNLLIDEETQGDIYILLYQTSPDDPEELFVFYKNKLAKVAFLPDVSDFDKAGLLGVYSGIFDTLAKSYGQPIEGSITLNKNTLDQYLTLFADQGFLSSEWKVGGTKIVLLLKATDTEYTISMQYVDASVETQVEAAIDAME
ncbi:hypothetical protein D3C81_1719030 [compost metagenome]